MRLERTIFNDETYTTVSTVSAAATLGGLVDLDALDDQGAGVETLAIGVGLSVLEQINDVLSGLDGPAGLGDTELLAWKPERSVQIPAKFLPDRYPQHHQ